MPKGIINQDVASKIYGKGEFKRTGLTKQDITKRAKALKTEGDSWRATWKDLSQYIYPTKGFFDTKTPNQGSKIDHTILIDEEATFCVDIFKSGMTSGFTSPSRPWFELYLDNPMLMQYEPVKWWLDDVKDIMLEIFQRSNTYQVLTSMYAELAIFGTACCYIEEDYDTVIRLREYTAGEYYIGVDEQGRANAFYREYWMQVGSMVKKFGIENCSDIVQQFYNQNQPDKWIKVNHLVEENENRVPFFKDYRNMPYRSIYWESSEDTSDSFLSVGGYEEFPFIAPTWEKTVQTDSYGKGAGWKAIGSVRELQKKCRNFLVGLDKETNPPLQADGSVKGEVNTLPGGITRFSAQLPNAGVKPTYQVSLNLEHLDKSIADTKEKIRQFFYTNLFAMMIQAERQGRDITATEVVEKQQERLSILGPILERWQGDSFIEGLISRTFNIAMSNGIFPEPPPELQGTAVKIRYTSILAQAQKIADIASMNQWVMSVVEMGKAGNPDVIDLVNFDEWAKIQGKMLGIPARVMNSQEAIAQMREARRKIAAQQEAHAKMASAADIASKGAGAAKTASEASMEGDTALNRILSSVTGAQSQ